MTLQAPVKIATERRFPLDLVIAADPIGELYEAAKNGRWNPETDVPWARFAVAALPDAVRAAARRVWSRRAWLEFSGLAATPALVIRFCLERDREIDPKYFLTVRNTEEAWHIECFHQYAEACGGYLDSPANPAWTALFSDDLYRQALNAEHALDAYVVTQCAFVDSLELALHRATLAQTREPVARAILEHCIADGERHARFGWLYAERRLGNADAAQRAAVVADLQRQIATVEFAGYHCVGLATDIDAAADISDLQTVADAGLGALNAAAEIAVFQGVLAETRTRLAALGVQLPVLTHKRLGAL